MSLLLTIASVFTGTLSVAGHVQAFLGTALLARFRKKEKNSLETLQKTTRSWPAVSILKPLHGPEALLEKAFESFFRLDYPDYELVFGVHHEHDPALEIIQTLKQRYPQQKIAVVIDSTEHGPNRKIGNLMNLQRACQHDIFVISDSDIHVQPDYLKHIVATLKQPGTHLVTTLYAGLPADKRLVRLWGAHSINTNFLPGVMMARLIGRQDCLGATMALTRKNLANIGGFSALINHIADDSVLGQLIREHGGAISLAPTICLTTVAENNIGELFSHELRWGRTVRSVEPVGYTLSSLQLPLFWASLSVLFAPTSWESWAILGIGWIVRGITTSQIARLTKCNLPGIFPFLVIRDWLSAAIMICSARGSHVAWRGQTVCITPRKTITPTNPATCKSIPFAEPTYMNRSIRS